MAAEENVRNQVQGVVRVIWILSFTVVVYIVLTLFLIVFRGNVVRLTLIFEDTLANGLGVALVAFLLPDLYLTHYFYKRTLRTPPSQGYIYALATVIVGVAVPYIYGLLLSFMGIMRDIFPLLFVLLFYISGIIVGLRIIPELTEYLQSD